MVNQMTDNYPPSGADLFQKHAANSHRENQCNSEIVHTVHMQRMTSKVDIILPFS